MNKHNTLIRMKKKEKKTIKFTERFLMCRITETVSSTPQRISFSETTIEIFSETY